MSFSDPLRDGSSHLARCPLRGLDHRRLPPAGPSLPAAVRAAFAIVAGVLMISLPALAAVIVVNDTCSLVDAINAANQDDDQGGLCPPGGTGADTLVLTTDVTLTTVDNSESGPTGLPTVTSEITIDGGGFTVTRAAEAPEFRILSVGSSGDLALVDTTVSHGVASGDTFPDSLGGGILNFGDLALTSSTVSGNVARLGGGLASNYSGDATLTSSTVSGNTGGGVFSYFFGSAELIDSTVSGNTGSGIFCSRYGSADLSSSRVSGNSGRGVAVDDEAFARLMVSTVSENLGGGVFVGYESSITLENTTVSSNSTDGSGGGAFNSGFLTVRSSTISGNYAGRAGGGVYSIGDISSATIVNSTVSGNEAVEKGGGIFLRASPYYGSDLTNITVSGNSAGGGGGGIYSDGITAYLANVLVAASLLGSNCSGTFADEGGNFDDDGTCGAGFGTLSPVDDVDLDHDLLDNGGPTRTHELPAGSVAIDAAGNCGLEHDQRGAPRDDGACDSGAYERGPCESLLLEGPEEVGAGLPFDLTLSCASANALLRVAAGRDDRGSTRFVPGCGSVHFDIGPRANNFGTTRADELGNAISTQNLGEAFGNETLYYQALDNSTCELSNVLAVEVEKPGGG